MLRRATGPQTSNDRTCGRLVPLGLKWGFRVNFVLPKKFAFLMRRQLQTAIGAMRHLTVDWPLCSDCQLCARAFGFPLPFFPLHSIRVLIKNSVADESSADAAEGIHADLRFLFEDMIYEVGADDISTFDCLKFFFRVAGLDRRGGCRWQQYQRLSEIPFRVAVHDRRGGCRLR